MDKLIPVKFNNDVVITTKTLAEVYECDVIQIQQNFNNNKDKFEEGKHYYKLEGGELKEFKNILDNFEDVTGYKKNTARLILWTKRGASRHCKMLGTDKAWDMFDTLEENYFNSKLPQLTRKEELQLQILNGTGTEQIGALKEYEQVITQPLKEKIEKDKPKVDAYERFLNSEFTYNATALKGIFGFPSPQSMNKKLHELRLIYKPGNSTKWTAYKDTPTSWYKVLATKYGDDLKWTSKGILGIAELLDKKLSAEDIENLINEDEVK